MAGVTQPGGNSWNDSQKALAMLYKAPAECYCCRADKALQDIVYKVVPGLYRTEMQNRVKFYSSNPHAEPANAEDAGEVADSLFFSPEDDISMSIEYFDNFK